ncbi:hypothetical protein BGZ63DRAFT_393379 [Mariannaea sp. PMI_226]|nr:hypothetical protein BGZ63DRAFT_393379 [Mariannaea sp. PMI_226]
MVWGDAEVAYTKYSVETGRALSTTIVSHAMMETYNGYLQWRPSMGTYNGDLQWIPIMDTPPVLCIN